MRVCVCLCVDMGVCGYGCVPVYCECSCVTQLYKNDACMTLTLNKCLETSVS